MDVSSFVAQIDSPALAELCEQLARRAPLLEKPNAWPAEQLRICGRAGVYRWFVDRESGGFGWSTEDQLEGYVQLSAACLTTTFVITQRMAAVRRIASSPNRALRDAWLDRLLEGECFATVGLSHLTTSRRHLQEPALRARRQTGGYLLEGLCPWVTGGNHADLLVVGAVLEDGRQLLLAVPASQSQVRAGAGFSLLALSASDTGRVDFDRLFVPDQMVVAGPVEQVLSQGSGGGTGGLQTSALALGLCLAAVNYLREQTECREELRAAAENLAGELQSLRRELRGCSRETGGCQPAELRGRANRLVTRATQAALTAAKGAGFVQGHPVGRWCREALFFLVWSCPQPVSQAHLCELAGLSQPPAGGPSN